MNKHLIWLLAPLLLTGCEQPTFVFRGYNDLSSCRAVIDAEMANGSEFLGSFDSTDVENPGMVTELSGRLFDQRVDIAVNCSERGEVQSVHYVSTASEPADTAEVFIRFAEELAAVFGSPVERSSDFNLSLRFLCDIPSPIMLEEWRLAADDEEPEGPDDNVDNSSDGNSGTLDEVEHEVYVAIVPSAVRCLDAD